MASIQNVMAEKWKEYQKHAQIEATAYRRKNSCIPVFVCPFMSFPYQSVTAGCPNNG
jgi:hypothetical protein